jgi:hypothetical protein
MVVFADTDIAFFSTISLAVLIVALVAISVEVAVLWFHRSSTRQTPSVLMSQTEQTASPSITTSPSAPISSTRGSVGVSGNIEFERLEPENLKQVAVVAQALDNQWVPRTTLAQMLKDGSDLEGVQTARGPVARAEYIRSLINAEQVVINRAFLRNSDVIIRDYIQEGDGREAFKDLLGSHAIVPWLYNERSPLDLPRYNVVQEAVTPWERLCQEVQTGCVRFSWNDALNDDRNALLRGRFEAWARTLSLVIRTGRVTRMMDDLGLNPEQQGPFEETIRAVSRWAVDAPEVTRDTFYYQFVVADNSSTEKGKYDASKPFAGELKQLADLSYNTNLPDALGRYALTPIDSLPRTSLQELAVVFRDESRLVTGNELKKLLQRTAFDLIQGGAFLKGMEHLTLRDVQHIRGTDEWFAYIQDLKRLLDYPFEFGDRAQAVYNRYIQLATTMTGVARASLGRRIEERWTPAITLIVNLGGAVLSAVAEPAAPGIASKITYNFVGNVGQSVATAVARLIIGGVADKRAQAALETSVDFMRVRVQDAERFWEDLKGELGARTDRTAETLRSSQDVYDPNINYTQDIAALDPGVAA